MSAFVWTPSGHRIIPLWDYAGTSPRGQPGTPLPLRWPDKPALAVFDFSLDATGLLGSATDTMTLAIGSTGPLALVMSTVLAGVATLWLGDGTPGGDNVVDLTLATASGRLVRRFIRILVTP
jgi:hypothetical protein